MLNAKDIMDISCVSSYKHVTLLVYDTVPSGCDSQGISWLPSHRYLNSQVYAGLNKIMKQPTINVPRKTRVTLYICSDNAEMSHVGYGSYYSNFKYIREVTFSGLASTTDGIQLATVGSATDICLAESCPEIVYKRF